MYLEKNKFRQAWHKISLIIDSCEDLDEWPVVVKVLENFVSLLNFYNDRYIRKRLFCKYKQWYEEMQVIVDDLQSQAETKLNELSEIAKQEAEEAEEAKKNSKKRPVITGFSPNRRR